MKVDMDELRAELLRHKYQRNLDHVTSKRLSYELPYSTKQLGAALSRAEDHGWVTRVARSSQLTYYIELGDDADADWSDR